MGDAKVPESAKYTYDGRVPPAAKATLTSPIMHFWVRVGIKTEGMPKLVVKVFVWRGPVNA